MFELKDLKKFAELPAEFNGAVCREIEKAVDEYDRYRGYIVRLIDRRGESAYKDVGTYLELADDIRYEKYPDEAKMLAVIGKMCMENCGNDAILKYINGEKKISEQFKISDIERFKAIGRRRHER